MPYRSREAQRRAARESARRRRAARRGSTPSAVEPLNRGPAPLALSPAELSRILAEELRTLRERMEPGDPERCRVVVALVTAALRCYETGDVAGRLEALEAVIEARTESTSWRVV